MSDPVEIRRAADRFRTNQDGITTFHSFSYGPHYDADNIGFGPVIAINEECIPPGGGYDLHRHADVNIFTVVLEGTLAHEDSLGQSYQFKPGEVRSVSAGEGLEHAERNASPSEPLRFLQVMTREVPVEVDLLSLGLAENVTSVASPALVHVVRGQCQVAGEVLGPGDEIRLSAGGPYDVTASGPTDALIVQVR